MNCPGSPEQLDELGQPVECGDRHAQLGRGTFATGRREGDETDVLVPIRCEALRRSTIEKEPSEGDVVEAVGPLVELGREGGMSAEATVLIEGMPGVADDGEGAGSIHLARQMLSSAGIGGRFSRIRCASARVARSLRRVSGSCSTPNSAFSRRLAGLPWWLRVPRAQITWSSSTWLGVK